MKYIASMIEISPEDLEQIPLPTWKEGLAMAAAAAFGLALLTQGAGDPSPFSLVSPAEGISNWFGLTGSLVAGLFLDLFGSMAYVLPLMPLLLRFAKPTPVPLALMLLGIWYGSLVAALGFALTLAGIDAAPYVGIWGLGVVLSLGRILGNLIPLGLFLAYVGAALPRLRLNRTCLVLLLMAGAWLAKRSGNWRGHFEGAAGQVAHWLAKGQALLQRSRQATTPVKEAPTPTAQPARPQDLLHQALAAYQDHEQDIKDNKNK